MHKYFLCYCELINSKEQLDYCQQANSLKDLLARIKSFWSCEQLSDVELIGELTSLNQIPIDESYVNLVGQWLPYRYQPKRQLMHWLIPIGHATEPFQDEYISRCRQHLINQIIQPCSTPMFAQRQAEKLTGVEPAGFIFHLSRCGSTLISGCLSELDSTCVFSESPLLTELLLDNNLSTAEQKNFLQAFINLQAAAFPNRPQMIIKWNAWDIFRWDTIRELYPQVPVIFLVRNPMEILASHQRSAGRHMSGDSSLAALHPTFAKLNKDQTLLEFRAEVLHAFMFAMQSVAIVGDIKLTDYRELNAQGLESFIKHFGVSLDQAEKLRIERRSHFHSKAPAQVFRSDIDAKQSLLSLSEMQLVESLLQPIYHQLTNNH